MSSYGQWHRTLELEKVYKNLCTLQGREVKKLLIIPDWGSPANQAHVAELCAIPH